MPLDQRRVFASFHFDLFILFNCNRKNEMKGQKKRKRSDDQPRAPPSRPFDNVGLLHFYEKVWLPLAADFLLTRIALLDGSCEMPQRELVLQYWEFPRRNCVFRNKSDVMIMLYNMIRFDMKELPVNIHYGPVWPAQHIAEQPIWTPGAFGGADLAPMQEFPPNIDLLKPRKFERSERGDSARGELVIDVDMDEKKRIAVNCCDCGKRRRVCQRCWTLFMWPAQRILTYIVREHFGFKRCFTVFSGRRGFHMWIMDRRVLDWTFHERRAFIARLTAPLRLARAGAQHRDPMSDFVWDMVIKPQCDAHPEWGICSRDQAFCCWYPELDERVSSAPDHLHKGLLMMHPNSGYFCDVLADPDNVKDRFLAKPSQLITLQRLIANPEIMMACVAQLEAVLNE
jgi:hypothetical protein